MDVEENEKNRKYGVSETRLSGHKAGEGRMMGGMVLGDC